MAGLTELSKTTDPIEILRILQEEAYKAELPKSEQQGLLTKPTISKDDESYGIVKFISDWWTDSEEKVKEARKEVLEGLVNMPMPTLPQPPVPDELMDVPTTDSEPVIEGAPEQPEMLVPEPYKLDADTRGNELGLRGLMSPELKESIDETVSDVVTESVADGVQPTDGKDLPWDLSELTKDISDNRKTNLEYAYNHAVKNGLEGTELAAYMAQLEHESHGFRRTEEYASGAAYEDRKDLGNTQKGDGKKYKGRGYIQLTGRANYAEAGKDLGYDLIGDPKQIQKNKKIAADVSLWFWKNKVRPKVEDWSDTRKVTYLINGGYNGLKDRKSNFSKWMKSYTKTLPEGTSPRPMLRPDEEEE